MALARVLMEEWYACWEVMLVREDEIHFALPRVMTMWTQISDHYVAESVGMRFSCLLWPPFCGHLPNIKRVWSALMQEVLVRAACETSAGARFPMLTRFCMRDWRVSRSRRPLVSRKRKRLLLKQCSWPQFTEDRFDRCLQ